MNEKTKLTPSRVLALRALRDPFVDEVLVLRVGTHRAAVRQARQLWVRQDVADAEGPGRTVVAGVRRAFR